MSELERKSGLMRELLEKALERGYLTTDDVMKAFPEAEENLAQLENLFIYLHDHDIYVYDETDKTNEVAPRREQAGATEMPLEKETSDLRGIPVDDTVSLYFREMARVPLLTSDEEAELAKRLETGRQAQQRLATNGGDIIEKAELWRQIEAGKEARDHLIRANTRLVISVAKKYVRQGIPFLDLIQEGNLGLMKAVDKFDYRRGYKFSTYATWWIRQAISRALADQGRTIRLPVHMSDRIRKLYRTARRLEQDRGRPPTPEEIAEEMDVHPRKVRRMLRVSQHTVSLEKPVGEEEDSELGSFIEDDETPIPPEAADHSLLREKLEEVLGTLSPREARVLRLRFGLQDGHNYTLEEIGRKFGVTRERIRQIEKKALRRLRHPRRSRQLKDYLS